MIEKIDVEASYPDIFGRGELQPRCKDRKEEKEQCHISSNGSANFNQISRILVFTDELFLASDFVGCSRERSGRPTTTTETTTAASGANNRGGCCLSVR